MGRRCHELTAQETPAPQPEATPAPAPGPKAVAAPAPPPQAQNPLRPVAADMSAVKVIVVYDRDGAEATSEIMSGTLRSNGVGNMGSALVKGFFTFGLAGSLSMNYEAFGDSADTTLPRKVRAIRLEGYSPKTMGSNGPITLIQPKVDKDKRGFGIDTGSIASGGFKHKVKKVHLKKVAKSQLTKKDGVWTLGISEDLAPGTYMLVTPEIPYFYWDFDVK